MFIRDLGMTPLKQADGGVEFWIRDADEISLSALVHPVDQEDDEEIELLIGRRLNQMNGV